MNTTLYKILEKLQASDKAELEIDGWLGYDFRGRNSLFRQITGLPENTFFTRRFFYWAPLNNAPIKIVHKIDEPLVHTLQGKTITYRSQSELESTLFSFLRGKERVAMEYWPHAVIPLLSVIDAGTKEFIELSGVKVVSSWNLVSKTLAALNDEQRILHKKASQILKEGFQKSWEYLKRQLDTESRVYETTLQKIIIDHIHASGAECDHPPIVAANMHSAIPHFENSVDEDIPIGKKNVVLIDAWCRMKSENAVYADLTDMVFTDTIVPEPLTKLYRAAQDARKKTISYIKEKYANKEILTGERVDLFTRSVLKEHDVLGLSLHRTGHNIFQSVHGPSTNFDCFETIDSRELFENHLYSIEPGLYVEGAYGVRLECNIYLNPNRDIEIEEASGITGDTIQTI